MIFLEEKNLNKYITSKKHKTTNYFKSSVVTATVLLSSTMLNAQTVLSDVEVIEKTEKVDYTQNYKVDKSSSSKVTQDLVDTPQTISVITKKVIDTMRFFLYNIPINRIMTAKEPKRTVPLSSWAFRIFWR